MSSLKRPPAQVKPTLTLHIAGKPYDVRPIEPGGFGTKAWRLEGAEGQVYDVIRTHFGIVECDCPSYEFRLKGNCITSCKHGHALITVGLLDAPEVVEAPRDDWADHDGWRVALGASAADEAWWAEETREHAPDDFPPVRRGAEQPTPMPLSADDDEAYRA
jgi:hypothetical protein